MMGGRGNEKGIEVHGVNDSNGRAMQYITGGSRCLRGKHTLGRKVSTNN